MSTKARGRLGYRSMLGGGWTKWLACGVVWGGLLVGCSEKKEEIRKPPPPPAAPVFVGPKFLHGTVGSLTQIDGYRPLLVSGWGFMTNLEGTGSSEVPAFLRQWLITEMRRRGVGSYKLGTAEMSPEELIRSTDTAVVKVEGLIPPGAKVGRRFDVLVSALPGTQTTSLENGQLWTTDLSIYGANPRMIFTRKRAQANGTMYLDPFEDELAAEKRLDLERSGAILAGGVVTEDRALGLMLNEPSSQRARLIADRINERFPHEKATQFFNTAVARNAQRVELNIPQRYAGNPERFLGLVKNLYLQYQEGFEVEQARRLVEVLKQEPKYENDVALAWESLGKTVLPTLRGQYESEAMAIRLAALAAGTALEDQKCLESLLKLAAQPDAELRKRAAALLAPLSKNVRATEGLNRLLDDVDRSVRLAAYESLAAVNDPILDRFVLGERENFKFVLDLVPAKKPLVYLTVKGLPRVVVFSPRAGFKEPLTARFWNNRLMMRADGGKLELFYQPLPGRGVSRTLEVGATIVDLAIAMASPEDSEAQKKGLNLSFSRVANVLYQLDRQKDLEGPLEVQVTGLAEQIKTMREEQVEEPIRPETTGPTTEPAGDVPGVDVRQDGDNSRGQIPEGGGDSGGISGGGVEIPKDIPPNMSAD
ncbi:MAG: flagellar basal body P-ring protein FlgI [Phycisphaeraceae bacterium]|nr:flagellar basal body P-ring protein FlgI [Phycisphaeraceae bacterium]